ncbi:hypothetical protein HKCCSP123_16015 [Rhodobacterales bacterium HKCCSP123]|nr:hypothetical protein [Rhodobacterales bacterium HKCCSP123]
MRIQTTAHRRDGPGPSDRHPVPAEEGFETVLRGLAGALCPSVTGYLERLIDRQAADAARGVRP